MYLHVLKSGGSAIKEFIRNSICGEENPECKNVSRSIVRPEACKKAVMNHTDYFIFSFARNPFSRMFSMYSMMDGFPPKNRTAANLRNRNYRYPFDPSKMQRGEFPRPWRESHLLHNLSHDVLNASELTNNQTLLHAQWRGRNMPQSNDGARRRLDTADFPFSDFVLKPRDRARHTSMSSTHYIEQAQFVFSKEECPCFDFLGRVEHFDEDMKIILHHINATKMIRYFESIGGKVNPVNTWGSNKKMTLGGNLSSAYVSKAVVNRVISEYYRDFKLLGYNIDEVPEK